MCVYVKTDKMYLYTKGRWLSILRWIYQRYRCHGCIYWQWKMLSVYDTTSTRYYMYIIISCLWFCWIYFWYFNSKWESQRCSQLFEVNKTWYKQFVVAHFHGWNGIISSFPFVFTLLLLLLLCFLPLNYHKRDPIICVVVWTW